MPSRRIALRAVVSALLLFSPLAPMNGRQAEAKTSEEQDALDRELSEARGLLRLGRTEEGLAKLDALRARYPSSARVVLLYGKFLSEQQRSAEAIQVYQEAIDRVDDASPILMDLERVHREAGHWAEALEVCLEYQERFGTRGAWVANELESLVRSDRLPASAIESIGAAVHARPEDMGLADLWILALFGSEQGSRALEEAEKLESARGGDGRVLLKFASAALDRRGYEVALEAYDRALALDLTADHRAEARYKKAQVLRKLRRLDEALLTYDQLLAENPQGGYAQQARLDKAEILARELNRGDDAVAAYQDLIKNLESSPRGGRPRAAADSEVGDRARLALADCQIRTGSPDSALRVLRSLADSCRTPEVRARSLFECGEMLFYQGQFKEAEEAYYKLTDLYPGDRWVNDALERILVIGENRDSGGGALQALAQAAYQRRLGQLERGVTLIDEALRAFPGSRAADDLMLSRERLLFELGKIEPALSTADTLALEHKESRLAPRGLLEAALELVAQEEGKPRAREYLERVVVEFPQSIDAREARAMLQQLKSGGAPGSSTPAPRTTGGGG